jgi:hypothetical protein
MKCVRFIINLSIFLLFQDDSSVFFHLTKGWIYRKFHLLTSQIAFFWWSIILLYINTIIRYVWVQNFCFDYCVLCYLSFFGHSWKYIFFFQFHWKPHNVITDIVVIWLANVICLTKSQVFLHKEM